MLLLLGFYKTYLLTGSLSAKKLLLRETKKLRFLKSKLKTATHVEHKQHTFLHLQPHLLQHLC